MQEFEYFFEPMFNQNFPLAKTNGEKRPNGHGESQKKSYLFFTVKVMLHFDIKYRASLQMYVTSMP